MPARPSIEALYEAHADAAWNAAWHLLGDAAAAEDVVHDVFARLVAAPAGSLAIAEPRAYVLTAVLHGVRSRARASARRGVDAGVDPDALPSAAPQPGDAALVGERAAAVAGALAALPLEQREVVVLRVFGGLPFREVAALCGTSANTAASRWRYACARLREHLERQGVGS